VSHIFKNLLWQFLSFAGVGVIGTLAQYVILVGLVTTIGLDLVIASGAGFTFGAVVNYALNSWFTFRSNMRRREAMSKFFCVALIGLVLNSLVMALATNMMQVHYFFSQLAATGIVLIWSFAGNYLWTFREHGVAHEQ
jgi:putative flippase GtrA